MRNKRISRLTWLSVEGVGEAGSNKRQRSLFQWLHLEEGRVPINRLSAGDNVWLILPSSWTRRRVALVTGAEHVVSGQRDYNRPVNCSDWPPCMANQKFVIAWKRAYPKWGNYGRRLVRREMMILGFSEWLVYILVTMNLRHSTSARILSR